MAARLNLRQQDQTRSAIQTSQLVNRLQSYALGEIAEIETGRLKAIEILLRKTLPDLSAVTLAGDEDNPVNVVHVIERRLVRPNAGN
ncbi:hypothetical protein [Mesorhizobium wenxiniae]|uniref:Uncharacterized protein n=1 Tax=Mesorhizobium wenxiniae TaxID=2014805 RepID=A0A271KE00_9HYPH|nr:hypothetical protein [Mesorhizobium wenxiniae]PAP94003.1 hypothetical protein CIT31_16685 [Mesorhizobium wenxiniae]